MKKSLNLGFLVSVVACTIILNALPIDDTKLALHKLSPLLQGDMRMREQVAEHCAALSAKTATPIEKFVLERLPVPARESGGPECSLVAQSSKATRLGLRSFWDFQVQIRNADAMPIADGHYALDFPRPLVLLPLVVFLLALIFEFRHWGLGWTLGSYLFLLCGANLIRLIQTLGQGVRTAFVGEQTVTGLVLITIWVALVRNRRTEEARPVLASTVSNDGRWMNRAILGGVGLWNPAAFTIAGRLFLPFQGAVNRIASFLTAQVAAVCLSLYLFSFEMNRLGAFASDSLLLPRYFTFGALIFMFLQHERPKREPIAWKLGGFWRTLLCIVAIEASAFHFRIWDGTSTITRIGLALVLSQLLWPAAVRWKPFAQQAAHWSTIVVLSACIAVLSAQLSVTDLTLLIFDPRIHPTGVVFFTFLSGIILGFVTGSFAVAFFALFATLMKTAAVPLVKAALLDGILAGILLSPLSIHNLLPAAQFGLSMSNLIAYRFKQLAFPLAIGTLIYAVAAINSVAILRPATFVFLCLIAVVVQLKRKAWKLKNYTISLDSRSGAN